MIQRDQMTNRGRYASEFRRVGESAADDDVQLSIKTASGDALERAVTPETWEAVKEDGPTLYACPDHDQIADETGEYYPGYALRCPVCESAMERIAIVTR